MWLQSGFWSRSGKNNEFFKGSGVIKVATSMDQKTNFYSTYGKDVE